MEIKKIFGALIINPLTATETLIAFGLCFHNNAPSPQLPPIPYKYKV